MACRNLSRSVVPVLLVTGALFLQACSPGKTKQSAEEGVAKFHTQLDAEQYHDIYSQASSEFRKSAPEADLTEFFRAIHRKLSKVQAAHEERYFVNYTTNGTMVTLTYKTDFANGPGSEQFVWRVGDQPSLVSYRVDSRVLLK